jgi:peptidyl-prolyl cis-trans isomerase SurA
MIGIMKRTIAILSFLTFGLLSLAQTGGPVVFTVGGDTIYGAEFERVYSKNNRTPDLKPTITELEEYRTLYIKFKLKVKEAYALGMQNDPAFIKELAGYRKQLAQPYLTDKQVTEKLLTEAYDRMGYEVDASNLMIHLSPNASPADTLEAFKRIQAWRNSILSGDRTFEQMATDSSTDPHGRQNEGRLGYFTAFNMLYSFENHAFNTKPGDISPIFRTEYGYHILKVNDKRKARPDMKVAHIQIVVNNPSEKDEKKAKIDEIYKKLQEGASWESMVEYSEDFSSRAKGGELNWMKSIGGSYPAAFKDAAYALSENGAYSKPVLTSIGWHIIKRIDTRSRRSFEDMKETLKFKISRDSRSELNKDAVLKRIKEENNSQLNMQNWQAYVGQLDNSCVLRGWQPSGMAVSEKPLLSIDGNTYTMGDFSSYLVSKPSKVPLENFKPYVNNLFESWVDEVNLKYEESILEKKYDDFRFLMQEYRDGILLFELTNEKVWNKASEDTAGLKTFFEKNIDNYQWNKRARVKSYVCHDAKTAKKVKKWAAKGWDDEKILGKALKKNPLALEIKTKTIEQGKDTIYDKLNWNNEVQELSNKDKAVTYVKFEEIIPAGPKELKETLGPAISDYQKYLEDQWIEELKEKYPVVVNEGALKQLFN